ncbi:MAG: class I SAM-dependent methyltransferase, partial [Chloroflexota bacterium]
MSDWVTQFSANTQVYFAVLEPMIDWLCAGQSPMVLDAGCGRCEPALLFADRGCQVVGVDVNAVDLEAANQLINQTP